MKLRLKDPVSRIPIEIDGLTADQMCGRTADAVANLFAHEGNRRWKVGDLFDVEDDGGEELRLEGDFSRVRGVGKGMRGGRIVADGSVGMHLGAGMSGGEIDVAGNAGDWVGAEMSGGRVQVRGSAGLSIGAAYPGSKHGMKGGEVFIHGAAGDGIGAQMRRGVIAVGGESGDFAGAAMLAGTILLFGPTGERHGAGMVRGTIALFGLAGAEPRLLPTFRRDCEYLSDFLRLYLRLLDRAGFPLRRDYFTDGRFIRYSGDWLEKGKGEILAWRATA